MKRKALLVAILLPLLFSCKGKADDADAARAVPVAEKNLVDTMTLRRTVFSREIVSNGVLEGARRAELAFAASGTVAKVYVHNGSRVQKGSPIAELDTEALTKELGGTGKLSFSLGIKK